MDWDEGAKWYLERLRIHEILNNNYIELIARKRRDKKEEVGKITI